MSSATPRGYQCAGVWPASRPWHRGQRLAVARWRLTLRPGLVGVQPSWVACGWGERSRLSRQRLDHTVPGTHRWASGCRADVRGPVTPRARHPGARRRVMGEDGRREAGTPASGASNPTKACRRRLTACARASLCAATAQTVSPRIGLGIGGMSQRSAALPEPKQAEGTRAWRQSRRRRAGADSADLQDLHGMVNSGWIEAQFPVGPHETHRQSA